MGLVTAALAYSWTASALVALTIAANAPVAGPISSSALGVSNSFTRPCSSTSTRSESMMVCRRWAMVSTVAAWNSLRIVACTAASVALSIDAVASSRTSTLGWRSKARPMHRSWRCPTLKFSPPSATISWSWFSSARTAGPNSTCEKDLRASQGQSGLLLQRQSRHELLVHPIHNKMHNIQREPYKRKKRSATLGRPCQ